MRKLKKDFLDKKIAKAEKEGIIKLGVNYDREALYHPKNGIVVFMTLSLFEVSKFKNVNIQVGDFLIVNGDLYDIKDGFFICTFETLLEIEKYVNAKQNDKVLKIIPFELLKKLSDALYTVNVNMEFMKLYRETIEELTLNHTVEILMNDKQDVIYMKNSKFNSWFEDKTEEEIRIKNLNIIPLENFVLVWNQYVYEFNKEQGNFNISPVVVKIIEVNKKNVDDLLFDFIEKLLQKDGVNKLSPYFLNLYDDIYNKIYNNDKKYYLTRLTTADNLNDFDIMDEHGNFVSGLKNEVTKKIKMLLEYVVEHLEHVDEEGVDIRILDREVKKGKFIVGQRRSTVVKGHVRRYKSGLRTLVKPHFRGGVNYDKGVCITF